MPMEREKTRIVDDLHARGWDEREDTGQNVSCTGRGLTQRLVTGLSAHKSGLFARDVTAPLRR